MALPWIVIWISALIVLAQRRACEIPFEHPLARILTISSPIMVWSQFRG
jgi:hypothetical protein